MKIYRTVLLILCFAAVGAGGNALRSSAQEKPSEFAIARAVIGTGIENLEPVGVAETFPASTEKVYCFIDATDITKDTEVSFVWFHGDQEMLKFSAPLKMGPRWRTYATKNLYGATGDWKVEIQDTEGKVLNEVKFKVE